MTSPFTTQSQAAELRGLDPAIIERMAERAYEAGKPTGSSLPPWPKVEPTYQAQIRREVVSVISSATEAGYLVRKP